MSGARADMSNSPESARDHEAAAAFETFLRTIAFRCEVFYRGQLCDAWSLDTSGSGSVNFHVVCHGSGWFRLPGWSEPQQLSAGDVIVLPQDASHQLASARDTAPAFGRTAIERQVPLDRTQPGTALVCGYLRVDPRAYRLVFAMLPPCLVVRAAPEGAGARLHALIELLFAEAQANAVGTTAILDRLADALMFLVICIGASRQQQSHGLIAALRDRALGPALCALIGEPQQPWTVEQLAERACLSRSAFADRFRALLGDSPMDFLTAWRMQLARRLLQQDRLSVPAVAERCGYQSEAAFSKAFKREVGVGPGEYRRAGAAP